MTQRLTCDNWLNWLKAHWVNSHRPTPKDSNKWHVMIVSMDRGKGKQIEGNYVTLLQNIKYSILVLFFSFFFLLFSTFLPVNFEMCPFIVKDAKSYQAQMWSTMFLAGQPCIEQAIKLVHPLILFIDSFYVYGFRDVSNFCVYYQSCVDFLLRELFLRMDFALVK